MTAEPDAQTRVPPAGLVLAAGQGRRFGGPKASARLSGSTLVDHAVALLRRGGCEHVIVVLGAEAGEVRGSADLGSVTVVENRDWRSGMGSSLRAGLDAAEAAGAPAVTVVLVDQPLLGVEAVRRVGRAWAAGAAVAVATYAGRRGHPVVLDRSVWDRVRAEATGDAGARRFMAAHPQLVTPVPCDGTGSPRDIDVPDDLQRMSAAVADRSADA